VRLVSGPGVQTSLIALMRAHAEKPLVLYRTLPDESAAAASLAQQCAPFSTNLVRLCGLDDVRDADTVADEKGELLRLTQADPGEAIIVRPDLYCADVVSFDEIVPALRRAMGMAMTVTPT